MIGHDGLADGQPHAHAGLLGAEKGLEEPDDSLFGHARPVILDSQGQHLAIFRGTDTNDSRLDGCIAQGIDCIPDQIEYHLLHLHEVDANLGDAPIEIELHVDTGLANLEIHERKDFVHHVVEVDVASVGHVALDHFTQTLQDAGRPARLRPDLVQGHAGDGAAAIVTEVGGKTSHTVIMARSLGWNDSYDLVDKGINSIYLETLDSSLRMAADALCQLGHRRFQTYRAIKTFRKHDELHLKELAEMRHDKKQLISGTRQRIEDLEELMLEEMENIGKNKDIGWDASTLIDEYGEAKSSDSPK